MESDLDRDQRLFGLVVQHDETEVLWQRAENISVLLEDNIGTKEEETVSYEHLILRKAPSGQTSPRASASAHMQFISLTERCPVRVAVAVHGKIFRTTTLSSVKGLLFVKQWMFSQTQLDIIVYECWWPHISDTAKRGGCQSGTVSLIRKTHDVLDDPQQWKHQRGWNALGFLPIGGRWGPQVYEDSGFEDWFWSRVVRFVMLC